MPDDRDDRDRLIRLTVVIEQLTEKVAGLTVQLSAVKDENIAALELAVGKQQDRLDRLEALVWKVLAAVALEALALIGQWIVKGAPHG